MTTAIEKVRITTHCLVCGFDTEGLIWGEGGRDPSWGICSCCGTEFGYEDCQLSAIKNARSAWVGRNYDWFEPKEKPQDWCSDEQMKNIPEEFR